METVADSVSGKSDRNEGPEGERERKLLRHVAGFWKKEKHLTRAPKRTVKLSDLSVQSEQSVPRDKWQR